MVNNIKGLREKRGLTQEELAEKVKCSPGHLSKVERGERAPSLKLMMRIARVLRCNLDDIFF
jgi:DNA-binding XRE family transcriptional regulator